MNRLATTLLAALMLGCLSVVKATTWNVVANQWESYSNLCYACTNLAQEGDTVLVGPGGVWMTNTLTIDRGVSFHLQGSGTNSTYLISAAGLSTVFALSSKSANTFAVSDFAPVEVIANTSGFFVTKNNTTTTGQFHFYNLLFTNIMYRGISPGQGDSFGCIDHCYFYIGAGAGSYNPVSFQGNDYASWTNAVPFGTTNECYVEDCFFQQTTGNSGNGYWDAYDGAQCVIRHCFFDGGAFTGTHGYDSQPTSTRVQECYNNIFTNQSVNAGIDQSRGGGWMIFSNTTYASGAQTANSLRPVMEYYRGANAFYQGTMGYAGTNTVVTFTNIDNSNYQVTRTFYPGYPAPIAAPSVSSPMVNTNLMVAGGSIKFQYFYTYSLVSSVSAADSVLVGSSISATLTNIALAINALPNVPDNGLVNASSPGYGTAFSTLTHVNHDFWCPSMTTNSLTLQNRMDGTNAYSWPAAMQQSVVRILPYTNVGVVTIPCYSWSNVCYVSGVPQSGNGFTIAWQDQYSITNNVPNYETNLLVSGRDYYSDVIPSSGTYTPLVYPNPLNNEDGPPTPSAPSFLFAPVRPIK